MFYLFHLIIAVTTISLVVQDAWMDRTGLLARSTRENGFFEIASSILLFCAGFYLLYGSRKLLPAGLRLAIRLLAMLLVIGALERDAEDLAAAARPSAGPVRVGGEGRGAGRLRERRKEKGDYGELQLAVCKRKYEGAEPRHGRPKPAAANANQLAYEPPRGRGGAGRILVI